MACSIKKISQYYQKRYQYNFYYPNPEWEELAQIAGLLTGRKTNVRYFEPSNKSKFKPKRRGGLRR